MFGALSKQYQHAEVLIHVAIFWKGQTGQSHSVFSAVFIASLDEVVL